MYNLIICAIFNIQVNLIITQSLGSMKTDCVISELCYNEVIYNRHITYSKIINLGAMTWLCYIENCTIVRRVIMRLNVVAPNNCHKMIFDCSIWGN